MLNCHLLLNISAWSIASCVFSTHTLKSVIIVSAWFQSLRFQGPIILAFTYVWGLSQISTGMEDNPGGSTGLSKLSQGLEGQLHDVKAEDVTLKGDYWYQVVEIVIGGVPIVLEDCFM
jgi:hypothetical protein